MWRCFRGKCSLSGSIQDGMMLNVGPAQTGKGKKYRVHTEQGLQLEPLCEEILAYLNDRMLSTETVRRNAVMQRCYKDEIVKGFELGFMVVLEDGSQTKENNYIYILRNGKSAQTEKGSAMSPPR